MSDGYLTLILNHPNFSPTAVLTLFLLSLMRIAPIIRFSPCFGAKNAPPVAKIGFGIAISFIFLPTLITSSQPIGYSYIMIGYALKEFLIGFIIGIFISIPFHVATSMGVYIDFLRGASILQMQDPTLKEQTSPIGVFYNLFLIIIFFQINGPFLFLESILKSYQLIPIDALINQKFFFLNLPFWKEAFALLHKMTALALQLSAPALLAVLMAETFLGVANRLAPQVQIAFLGMSLKSFLGLFLMWTSWFFVLGQIGIFSKNWIKEIYVFIHTLVHFKS